MTKSFYSNGKLLLTGEYAVLDGALSLAVPTKYGQSLLVEEIDAYELRWRSFDERGKLWFEGIFDLSSHENRSPAQKSPVQNSPPQTPNKQNIGAGYLNTGRHQSAAGGNIAETLSKILNEAQRLNPEFLRDAKGYAVETKLSFPRDWGLGSSSTLINNIAQWAQVDAYQLLWNAFSGSGYDIACAKKNHPILYRLVDGKPKVSEVDFNPAFQDQLYFVHLNKKQNSRDGIAAYRAKDFDKAQLIARISEITKETISCSSLSEFESLMDRHERLLSQTLDIPTVKASQFPDYKGSIKSLGAWGGDFVMATGNAATPSHFEKLGYHTVVRFSEMVLKEGI
ncbi:MAG: GYDIA family GHMP kinase [Pricia sp.]